MGKLLGSPRDPYQGSRPSDQGPPVAEPTNLEMRRGTARPWADTRSKPDFCVVPSLFRGLGYTYSSLRVLTLAGPGSLLSVEQMCFLR